MRLKSPEEWLGSSDHAPGPQSKGIRPPQHYHEKQLIITAGLKLLRAQGMK
jgi:hypothetical protein